MAALARFMPPKYVSDTVPYAVAEAMKAMETEHANVLQEFRGVSYVPATADSRDRVHRTW